jgi:hypothetical protein
MQSERPLREEIAESASRLLAKYGLRSDDRPLLTTGVSRHYEALAAAWQRALATLLLFPCATFVFALLGLILDMLDIPVVGPLGLVLVCLAHPSF